MGSLWNRSGTVERYADDLRATGAKAYFYLGGTNTPLTVYHNAGESSAHQHPVVADANGRWPDVFVPYISGYDVRVTSAFDVTLTFTQQIPNPNPVEVEVTVDDPLQVVRTGMCHFEFTNAPQPGYVRLNGGTIGSGGSGANERAHADVEDLYVHLWNLPNTVIPVSGGRGSSASSDFIANKQLTLPNMKGAMPIGLDDMGQFAGGYFTGLIFDTGNGTTPGSAIGSNTVTIAATNIPQISGTTGAETGHTHGGTTGDQSQSHSHSGSAASGGGHDHNVYIHDPKHTHTIGGGAASTVITGAASAGQAAGGANYFTSGIDPSYTGVRARRTPGGPDPAVPADLDLTTSGGAHTHSVSTGDASQGHTHSFTTGASSGHTHGITLGNASPTPLANLPRSVLVTWFIRL